MTVSSRWSTWVPAISATTALVLVAVAAGLPEWSVSHEPGRATSVGLWAICQEAQAQGGWRCDTLPDIVDGHDNMGATRAAIIFALASGCLAMMAAWVAVFSHRWLGAARIVALPLTLGAVIALAVGVGMWPGVHSEFWASPGLSLGASFALACASLALELTSFTFLLASTVLACCALTPQTFAPGDSEADEAAEVKAVPDFTPYFAEYHLAKDGMLSAPTAGPAVVQAAPRWPLWVAIAAASVLLLAAVLAAVAVALPDWSVQAAPGPKVQVGLWTICQEGGNSMRCDPHPDIVGQHSDTSAARIAAPVAVAFSFAAALLAALAILLRRWMLGFGLTALLFSLGTTIALGVAIGSWTGVHAEFWYSPGLRPGASFALACAVLALDVIAMVALAVALALRRPKAPVAATLTIQLVDWPPVVAKEVDAALTPPVMGEPCVTPACV